MSWTLRAIAGAEQLSDALQVCAARTGQGADGKHLHHKLPFQQPVGKCFSECKVLQNRSILACQMHEPKAEVSLDV